MAATMFDYDGDASLMCVGREKVPIAFFGDALDAPWFKARPVISFLEYGSITMTLRKLAPDDKLDLKTLIAQRGTPSGGVNSAVTPLSYNEGKAIWVSEAGLYRLIMGSEKTEAKALQRWVTHELLPTLRRTGEYKVQAPPPAEEPLQTARLVAWHKQRDEGKQATVLANATIRTATGNRAAGWDYAKIHDAVNWAATGRKTKALRTELGIKGTPRDRMAMPQLSMVAYVEAMTAAKVGEKRLASGTDVRPAQAVDEAGRLAYTTYDFVRGTGGHDMPLLAQAPPTVAQLDKALLAAAPTKRQRLIIDKAAMRPAAALPAPPAPEGIQKYFRTVPAAVPDSSLDLYD